MPTARMIPSIKTDPTGLQSAGDSLQKWVATSCGLPSLMVVQAAIEPYFGIHNDAAVKEAISSAIAMLPVAGMGWDAHRSIGGWDPIVGARLDTAGKVSAWVGAGLGVVGIAGEVAHSAFASEVRFLNTQIQNADRVAPLNSAMHELSESGKITRCSPLTTGWLTDVILNFIAKLKGKPTLREIDEDNENMVEINEIKEGISPDSWKKLLKRYPDLKALQERISETRSDKVARETWREIIHWFHDHKIEL